MSANIKASVDGTQAIIGVGGVDQMTVSNAGVVTANSFVGSVSSATALATGSTTARTLANRFADVTNVKDFGAVGDGVADDTAAIQAAVNFGRTVIVPYGTYKLTNTIVLSSGYSSIIGNGRMPFFKINPLIGPAFKINAIGSNLNEFSRIENVAVYADGLPSFSTTPNSTNCGIAIDGSTASVAAAVQRAEIKNCRVLGFSCAINVASTVNTLIERVFIEQHTDWSGQPGFNSSNLYIGVNLDGTPFTPGGISPQASIELVNVVVNGNFAPTPVTSQCFRITGQDPRDIFFDRCESVGGNYGYYIYPSSIQYTIDVHIRRPIIDGVKDYGIFIRNWGGSGSLTIDGGYAVKSSDTVGSAIYIQDSVGVVITGGFQIYGLSLNTDKDNGIAALGSNSIIISNTVIQNCKYGISLDNCDFCSIIGNAIVASPDSFEPAPVLEKGIRLYNGSTSNSVIGNIVRGASSVYKYTFGITAEDSSTRNNISSNFIDEATVTTLYNTVASNLIQYTDASYRSLIQSKGVSIISESSQQIYQGNDATYPHQFKDGSGNNLVGLNNAGAWIVNSDKNLKQDINDLTYGLDIIKLLNPKSYKFISEIEINKENCPTRIGLIAQDVEQIVPELVSKNENNYGLDYIGLIPILINSIKELSAKVAALESK
jgi:parallel beta-helix repeat protein